MLMSGIIIFLKPPGMSSNGAVGFFKKILDKKKVGHAGTLVPGACGVLVVLVGKATKLSDYLMDGDKEYIGEITFDAKTDTQDSYGQITELSEKKITEEMLENVLPGFIGEITQTPSRFSAIKVDGQKAYNLARKGEEFVLKQRTVKIHELELLRQQKEKRFLLRIKCSKGTYIRALFEDIGDRLETCAYMSFLERTKSGEYGLDDAVTMDEAKAFVEKKEIEKLIIPVEEVLKALPKATVQQRDYIRIKNGLDGSLLETEKESKDNRYRIYCKSEFLGIGKIDEERARIIKHLHEDWK